MRRHGRRHVSEYLENEELNETYETYEDYEETDVDSENEVYDEEEPQRGKSVWIKIGKVAVIILVLIALFIVQCFRLRGISVVPPILVIFDLFMFKNEFKKQGIIKRYLNRAARRIYESKQN